MAIIVLAAAAIMFFYTLGFSVTQWKEKNKAGAIVILIFAIAILIAPFMTLVRL